MNASTSFLRMRPPTPVPVTLRQVDAVLARRSAARPARSRASDQGPFGSALLDRCSRPRAARPGCAPVSISRQQRADRDRLVLLDQDLDQPAARRRRDLGVDLVGRDVADRLVGLDPVARVLAPARRSCPRRPTRPSAASSPRPGGAAQYARSSRAASFMSSSPGSTCCSSGGLNGIGTSGAVRRRTGRVEVLERLLADQRRDLGAHAARARRLVRDQHLAGLAHARQDRVAVERAERAQVDDLDVLVELARPPARRAPTVEP